MFFDKIKKCIAQKREIAIKELRENWYESNGNPKRQSQISKVIIKLSGLEKYHTIQSHGLLYGDAGVINLMIRQMPYDGEYEFERLYKDIPDNELIAANELVGSGIKKLKMLSDVYKNILEIKGFIAKQSNGNFKTTDKGRDLKNAGTYEKYTEEETRIRVIEKSQRAMGCMMVSLTFVIALGTAIESIFYFLEIKSKHKSFYKHYIGRLNSNPKLYTIPILVIGLLLTIIILIKRKRQLKKYQEDYKIYKK